MKNTTSKPRTKPLTGQAFDALSDAEKQRIFDEIEQRTPEDRFARSTKPTAAQQARLNRIHGKMNAPKMGRPKLGKGVKVVSVSVEVDLLKQADAYAKRRGMKRTELFVAALYSFLPARNAS